MWDSRANTLVLAAGARQAPVGKGCRPAADVPMSPASPVEANRLAGRS